MRKYFAHKLVSLVLIARRESTGLTHFGAAADPLKFQEGKSGEKLALTFCFGQHAVPGGREQD